MRDNTDGLRPSEDAVHRRRHPGLDKRHRDELLLAAEPAAKEEVSDEAWYEQARREIAEMDEAERFYGEDD
jgi:hypothetical protein